MVRLMEKEKQDLKQKRLFLLDMDGTIYLDNYLFDGVLEFLAYVKSIGGRYMFLTNNSSRGVDKYIEKLAGMGISSAASDFVTSVNATALYLKQKQYKKIYVFGTKSLLEQLKDNGLTVTDSMEEGIDCLCIGFDTELTFKKLEEACILLGRGVDFVATNPDFVCPTYYGFVPDCGSVCDMLYNATKRRPHVIGKPQPEMLLLAMKATGFAPEKTIMLGDRLYTDIASGVNAGVSSAFLLSGEGTLEDLKESDVQPTYVFENIMEFYRVISSKA